VGGKRFNSFTPHHFKGLIKMKNPCDICILKVTCTSVCPEKENYKTLLQTAIRQNSSNAKRGIPAGSNFRKYASMNHSNETETMKISIRRFKRR
jgi:L-lactate utilization protein LutB